MYKIEEVPFFRLFRLKITQKQPKNLYFNKFWGRKGSILVIKYFLIYICISCLNNRSFYIFIAFIKGGEILIN